MFVFLFLFEPRCSFYRHAMGTACAASVKCVCVSLLSRTRHSLGTQKSCSLEERGVAVQPGVETHRIKCRRNCCSTLEHQEAALFEVDFQRHAAARMPALPSKWLMSSSPRPFLLYIGALSSRYLRVVRSPRLGFYFLSSAWWVWTWTPSPMICRVKLPRRQNVLSFAEWQLI